MALELAAHLPAQETKRSDQDPSSQDAHALPWNAQH